MPTNADTSASTSTSASTGMGTGMGTAPASAARTRTADGAGTGGPAGTRRPPGHPGDGARRRTPARTRPASRRDQRRPVLSSPDPRRVTAPHYWFAEALLAVLSGQRPVHFLLGHTVGPAYEQLITLTQEGLPRHGFRPVLRHCGRFLPRAGVIEAFARVAVGDRVTAMAFRLERGQDLRWRCAAVEIAPRPY